ncbi:hypothetical protein J42TS3_06630 [Paenibacillus vini]|uniref:Uncharacterized protein n=1 Tax=Paenibacillus vini TaxID=1476024 RepID=A0ABQ4M6K2_9BACL|nr:hypothetical protein J42TS3_06630 [Paenibacillus vini]
MINPYSYPTKWGILCIFINLTLGTPALWLILIILFCAIVVKDAEWMDADHLEKWFDANRNLREVPLIILK